MRGVGMVSDLPLVIFGLHIITLAVLYGFLALVLGLVWRDLDRGSRAERAWLVVLDGGAAGLAVGQRLPLTARAVMTLGRTADNDICLPDPGVSATHATLSWRAGRWWLDDQGSRNGTVLNETRIVRPTLLCPGDVITLGQVRLRFEELTG